MNDKKHYTITIGGKVQGVFFRASTKAVADQLGVKGIIRNLPDGSVYAEAEGDAFSIDSFLDWCREGPQNARVEKVEIQEAPLKNYRNFEVLRKNS